MFKRKKLQPDVHVLLPEAEPEETVEDLRTTCYPQGADGPPPVAGQQRTTTYRQSLQWSRRGYDTIN